MNRKEFLKKTAIASSIISGFSITSVFANNFLNLNTGGNSDLKDLVEISEKLNSEFLSLIDWLKTNKWVEYLKTELNLDLTLSGEALLKELTKDIDANVTQKLQDLKKQIGTGFDDFAGNQLIKPGYPSLSLLYHILASPRVKPAGFQKENYPTILELDKLENYIYGLKKWEDYKKDYKITNDNDLVLAVFAYEYRPAYKTPHQAHADLVFSRTGIARIGDNPLNFDSPNRCYTNKPITTTKANNNIAVTPARYGLFLAKIVGSKDIGVMSTGKFKGKKTVLKKEIDNYDDHNDEDNYFLQPIRKVFNNDLLFDNSILKFEENHISEKLERLQKIGLSIDLPGTSLKRDSSELLETNSEFTYQGSSFLVISKVQPLIRFSKGVSYKVDEEPKNRYFTSFSKKEKYGFDIEILSDNEDYRIPNNYKDARNKPMYVHIAHKLDNMRNPEKISKRNDDLFETTISKGGYFAPVYEDSLCDGVVTINITNFKSSILQSVINRGSYNAFSIVTAPDFFQYVNVFDIVNYDVKPGISIESNFYEGGIACLASARIRPNPSITIPNSNQKAFPSSNNSDKLYNTLTAVISTLNTNKKNWADDYKTTSYLPDVCSSVFAPGWDVTYGNNGNDTKNIFLSTMGLGAPFVEDMKLCAAMNGMWPVASPDAARVYQGTVTKNQIKDNNWYRNPTAIPLMDDELGFHTKSPASQNAKRDSEFGWDGEQGPFLEYPKDKNSWYVNFTDLGRADYVENGINGKIDLSKLSELTSGELINRMEALRKSINSINNKTTVGGTTLWLISGEKLKKGNNSFEGHGIPQQLFGINKDWALTIQPSINKDENCYLFVFADTDKDADLNSRQWAESGADVKRRLQKCKELFVCQISENAIAKCKVISNYNVVKIIDWGI